MDRNPEAMLQYARTEARRFREADEAVREAPIDTMEEGMAKARRTLSGRALVKAFNDLDGWLMNGGHLPVSWSRPEATSSEATSSEAFVAWAATNQQVLRFEPPDDSAIDLASPVDLTGTVTEELDRIMDARMDSAGNVRAGWVLRYNGANRTVLDVTVHKRLPGENDRQVTMWLDGPERVDGDENQVVYVVNEGEPGS